MDYALEADYLNNPQSLYDKLRGAYNCVKDKYNLMKHKVQDKTEDIYKKLQKESNYKRQESYMDDPYKVAEDAYRMLSGPVGVRSKL